MTVILLPLPPSLNHLFPGHKRRYRSSEYESWIETAGWELAIQRPQKHDGKVSVLIEVREPPTQRQEDLANREKATMDLLVKHGVIKGDSQRYVRQLTLAWASDIQGIRITVTPCNS